jgi:hypothetical protein
MIYMLDQVTPKPGRAQAFLKAYMDEYAPRVVERGLKLEHTWVTPPTWLENQSNTLFFIWSVKGLPAWWEMQFKARWDQFLPDWWRDQAPNIEERRRCHLTDVTDVAELTNV